MHLVWMIVLGLTLSLPVVAQDSATYRIRMPRVDEYLEAIQTLPELPSDMQEIVDLELMTRYASDMDTQPYDLVDGVYRTLHPEGDYVPEDAEIFWFQVRVAAWLNSARINLDAQTEIHYQDAVIPVTAYDLDNDGDNEWLLDFQAYTLQALVFLRRDSAGIYRIVKTPLPIDPYEQLQFAQAGTAKAQWQVEHFGDLNADGQPEIVVLFTFDHDDYSNTGVTGRYYVLSWRDDALLDIGAETLSFALQNLQTRWEWLPSDGDAAWHLRQLREMQDNWDCIWEQTTIYRWDGSTFAEDAVDDSFPETGRCFMRLAEAAMWAGDYERAIQLYEQVAHQDTQDDTFTPGDYPYIRWATALALNGELERAVELLRSRQADPDRRRSLPELITALLEAYDENPTPFGLCLAAYDFHWFNYYYVWFEQTLEVGHTVDNIVYPQGMYAPPPASPQGAGCDAPALLEDLLAQHTFTTDMTPTEQLADLGISWTSVYHDDLNGDGIEEWLVTVVERPLFFVSDGPTYQVSRERIGAPAEPDEMNLLRTIQLPDDAGTALFSMSYDQPFQRIPLGYGLGGGPGECPSSGRVSVWKFTGHGLEPILSALLCEELEASEIVDDWQIVSTVRAWEFNDQIGDYVPAHYVWDTVNQSYELSLESQFSVTPAIVEIPRIPGYTNLRRGPQLFSQQQYDRIIAYRDDAMAEIPNESDSMLLYWRYLAALAYEALDRPNDALAEYTAVYEAAPESAWGMLAALHFEPIEP